MLVRAIKAARRFGVETQIVTRGAGAKLAATVRTGPHAVRAFATRGPHFLAEVSTTTTLVLCVFAPIAGARGGIVVGALPGARVARPTHLIEIVLECVTPTAAVCWLRAIATDIVEAIAHPLPSPTRTTFGSQRFIERSKATAIVGVAGFGTRAVLGLALPEGIRSADVVGNFLRIAQEAAGALAVFTTIGRAETAVILSQTEVRETTTLRVPLAGCAQNWAFRYAQTDGVGPGCFEQPAGVTIRAIISAQLGACPFALAVDVDAIA